MAEKRRDDLAAELALRVADELTEQSRREATEAMDALFAAVSKRADETADKLLDDLSDQEIRDAGFDGRRKLRAILADELEDEMMSEARDAIDDWAARNM